jgi:hypothetical protein
MCDILDFYGFILISQEVYGINVQSYDELAKNVTLFLPAVCDKKMQKR